MVSRACLLFNEPLGGMHLSVANLCSSVHSFCETHQRRFVLTLASLSFALTALSCAKSGGNHTAVATYTHLSHGPLAHRMEPDGVGADARQCLGPKLRTSVELACAGFSYDWRHHLRATSLRLAALRGQCADHKRPLWRP